jgi:hypothetical protein
MQVKVLPQEQSARPTAPAAEPVLERYVIYRAGLAYGRLVYRLRWLILVVWTACLVARWFSPDTHRVVGVARQGERQSPERARWSDRPPGPVSSIVPVSSYRRGT